jgi:uncharacterized phage-associated protein
MAITFRYDPERAYQAVLWFLHRHGGALPIMKLMKLLFFADRLHLWRYGRPLTGGRYAAMPHGPVASDLYEEVKLSTPGRPFQRQGNSIRALAPVDEEYLSESDVEVLTEIDHEYGTFDGSTLRRLTHETIAYSKNYKEEEPVRSFPLPYEDFFEDLALEDPRRQMLNLAVEDCCARDSLC